MAEADVTLLVGRLTSHSEALDRHNAAIQKAFENAQESLAYLRRVYGGVAAEDFLSHWDLTTEALEQYLDGARRLKEILDARVDSLRAADRPGDGG